jgi:26S proteasome regulatory subunit N2
VYFVQANFVQEKDDYVSTAIAYQIAFDLYDNGTQEFLAKVIKSLPAKVAEIPTENENRKYLWAEIRISR